MKKTLIVLMLSISILSELCAQTKNREEKTFEIPDDIALTRRFFIDLGQGNKVTIELSDISDLQKVMNMDSLLAVFWNDLRPLKDSLSDPLASKRIDYVRDGQGRKKIRIQQFHPNGNNYLVNNGVLSSLKINQDTINIIAVIVNPAKPFDKISLQHPRYYHVLFYLNNLDELTPALTQTLSAKLATLQAQLTGKWPLVLGGSNHYLKADKSISAEKARGVMPGQIGDMLQINQTINIQNYKNYFVPSASLGIKFVFSNRERTFKWEPALFWEPHFLFGKDSLGKLKTYRNDFLTLTYGQGGTTDHDPRKDFSFSAVFSLGYLIHSSGDFIHPHTFRFGAGKLKLVKTTIEPSIYFNNFFKGVTPGIRISQSF